MSVDVEQLLADASAARLSGAARTASDELLIIDPETRQIAVPENFLLGVESDQNVERVRFQCPKIVGDSIDLSKLHIYVNYQNANQEVSSYWCQDVEVSGDNITFSWLVSRAATMYQGETIFIVCAKKSDEEGNLTNEWNTTIPEHGGIVLEGLEPDPRLEQQYPDVIEQILTELDTIKAGGGSGITSVEVDVKNTTGTPSGTGSVEAGILKLSFSGLKGETGPQGPTGITQRQINALNEMFKICAYTQNPSSQYNEFLQAFNIGGAEPGESWKIINNLTNVVNNNSAIYVIKGSPYSATLTASEGYSINSVIVEMGGEDVTSTVYSDGSINISSVAGDVVITAIAVQSSASGQLPQDGLVDYFDFRNKSYTAGSGGLYYINSDFGNGMLYSWSNQSSKQGDNIGIKGAGGSYTSERATGYPVTDNFPPTRTVCMFGKGGPSVPIGIGADSTLNNSFLYQIKYIATDKTTKSLPKESIQYPEGFTEVGYNASFVIVNQNILKVYFDDTLHKTVDGSEIEDFESWDITPLMLTSFSNYGTTYAIYNKELSKVEIVEALEFFKTLEVSE